MLNVEHPAQLRQNWTFIRGVAYGVNQPSLLAEVLVDPSVTMAGAQLEEWMADIIPSRMSLSEPATEPSASQAVALVLHWACALQQLADLPVFNSPQVLSQVQGAQGIMVRMALPAMHSRAARSALQWAVHSFNALHAQAAAALPGIREQAELCLKELRELAPAGSNMLRFLRAAHERDIAWRSLAGNVYEFGQGIHTRWLDSSFTDRTSQIGAGLARDKQLAAQVMRSAGLPVPEHRPVNGVNEAQDAAAHLGYPVVVKPMDRDGGVGVAAGLTNPDQVAKAFQAARRHSKKILLEKHFEGRDYRLTVLDGALLWAVERQPGGICGDGQRSVAELLSVLNADPRRREDAAAPLKPLLWNHEAAELLQLAGLTPDSIVPAGQFIRLRRAANVASGGMPVAVMEQVHPHNRQLAERAAQALRLDLAGIDLLVPDISRSWQETGAAICEVNAQPQLGGITAPQIYGDILQHLVGGAGRVPITLLLAQQSAEVELLGQALRNAHGPACGYAGEAGVWLGKQLLAPAGTGWFSAGQMLLSHSQCEALVMLACPSDVLQSGLPFDRCDLLILAGQGMDATLQREVLQLVLPHAGKVLCARENLHWQAALVGQSLARERYSMCPEIELATVAHRTLSHPVE